MKGLYCSIFFLFVTFIGFGQTNGDYRSRQSGNWNTVSTWQVYDGGSWVNLESSTNYQNVIPSNGSGVISIEAATVVTINTLSVVADQLIVKSNATLTIASGGELILENGAGNDLSIQSATTVVDLETEEEVTIPGGLVSVLANAVLENKGQITSTSSNLFVTGDYQHNQGAASSIPAATWNTGSSAQIIGEIGTGTLTGLNQVFYDFIWNPSSQTTGKTLVTGSNPGLTTINHNFEIRNTSNTVDGTVYALSLTTVTTSPTLIKGNLEISGASRFNISTSSSTTVTVQGNVNINSTVAGTSLRITQDGAGRMIVHNNLSIVGTSDIDLTELEFTNPGSGTLEVRGNVSLDGGEIKMSSLNSASVGNVIFSRVGTASSPGVQTITNTPGGGGFSGNINYTINLHTQVNLGEMALTGPGNLALNGLLGVGSTHPNGALQNTFAGNLQNTGSRNYGAAATFIYNGSGPQALGDGFPGDVNLEIANTHGVTNNNIGVTNVVATLTLTAGALNIGSTNTLNIESNFITNGPSGGTIGGDATSSLMFSGDGTLGTLYFAPGKEILNNLTMARAGDLKIGTNLTIVGAIDLSFGNLDFSGHTLTMNGSAITAGSTGLKSNGSSNLIIGGSSFNSGIPFAGTNEINDLTLATTGGAANYDWNASVKVNGDVFLNSGTLAHSAGLTMGSNATFHKGGGAITGVSPNAETSYNVVYTGIGSTGLELPSSTTALNDLTIESSGTITLTTDVRVNGDVRLNTGTLAIGTGTAARTITMAGPSRLWLKALGSFSPGDGTVAIEGSIAIQGTNPQFGNLITRTGSSLTLNSSNIQVAGNLQLASTSTFTTNGASITFNGGGTATQTITPGGKAFDRIIVNRAGSGSVNILPTLNLLGTLDIRTATTVQSNGNLVLVSTSDGPTGNASILKMPAGASVVGNVVVQRYMSGEGRIYRDVAAPVQSGTVQQIIDSQIPVTFGSNPSMYRYNESVAGVQENGFVAVASASETLTVGKGYSVFVRETSAPRTIAFTGPINSGPLNLNVSFTNTGHADDGWNFVGNPYPSSIDWDESDGWEKVNIQGNMISVWDAGAGQFRTWNGSLGTLPSGLIAKGQGFWVKTNNNLGLSPSLQIDEDAKTSGTGAFLRKKADPLHYIEVILTGANVEDRAFIQKVKGSTLGLDNMDGLKLPYNGFSLSTVVEEDKRLAINAVGESIESGKIPLALSFVANGDYSFSVNKVGDFETVRLSIFDSFKETYTPIAAGENYSFTITDSPASRDERRFSLVFGDIVAERAEPVSVFPNPVVDVVNVVVVSEIQPEGELFDNLGQSVGSLSWTQYTARKWKANADISSLPSGLYFVRVTTKGGLRVVKFLKD